MVKNNVPEFELFRMTQVLLPSLIKRGRGRFFYKSPSIPLFKRGKLFVTESILRAEQTLGRANTLAFVVMPDHLHWLLQLNAAVSLAKILQSVKGLSAKRIGQPIWQAGFHDHALRQEEDLQAVARYVIANPLRAGLVERIGDYPHWDAIWF